MSLYGKVYALPVGNIEKENHCIVLVRSNLSIEEINKTIAKVATKYKALFDGIVNNRMDSVACGEVENHPALSVLDIEYEKSIFEDDFARILCALVQLETDVDDGFMMPYNPVVINNLGLGEGAVF